MDDLISRQAAISAIQQKYADTEGGDDKRAVWKNVGLTIALHIMQDLPSAQPTGRKTWRWIKKTDADGDYYCCSYCAQKTVSKTRYCPNCGKPMEVEP